MLVVEAATPDDVVAVSRIAADALPERLSEQWWLEHAERGDALVIARETGNDQVVGFAVTDPAGPCEARLVALAVAARHRGRGIGAALLKGVKRRQSLAGTMRLSLEVRVDDLEAQAFYASHGMTPEGLIAKAYSDGADAVRYAGPV